MNTTSKPTSKRRPVDLVAVREARARLATLAREHPELVSNEPIDPAEWERTLRADQEAHPDTWESPESDEPEPIAPDRATSVSVALVALDALQRELEWLEWHTQASGGEASEVRERWCQARLELARCGAALSVLS